MRDCRTAKAPLTATLMLWCFARLVPARYRWEWRQEWQSELWYVYRGSASASGFGAWCTCTSFALGAINDAIWFRWTAERCRTFLQSSGDCAACLVGLAAFSFALAWLIPGSHDAITSLNEADTRHLVSISRAGLLSDTTPTIDFAEYERWRARGREWFSDISFYRVTRAKFIVAGRRPETAEIAVAGESLARMLGLPIPPKLLSEGNNRNHTVVVLTPAAARRLIGTRQQVGTVLIVAGQKAVVSAVQLNLGSVLPQVDALLLVPNIELRQIAPDAPGSVLAQMTEAAQEMGQGRSWSFTTRENGENVGFVCRPVANSRPRPVYVLLFALFLACLALPATTPLPLGEYPAAQHPRFSEIRSRRWAFLAMKISCLILIIGFLSLVISFDALVLTAEGAACTELFTSFAGLLFSFRWALRDQRLRCPVCLNLLTSPARVGHPSRSFLAWHGTELICGKGHGLLHVPEIATSWFSTQRWLSLDGSWRALFPNLAER